MTAVADLDSKAGVLAAAREARAAELAATADQLRWAAEWAARHEVDSVDVAAAAEVFGETVIPIAGAGAPLVGEFCVAELAAAMGMPTDHGRWLLGEAVELKHRLPRLWGRVMRLELPAWRARRIARQTMELSPQAAAFVDRQIAHLAHRVGAVVVERLVEEAIARFMPETARERRDQAADGRRFVVDHRQVSFTGTAQVYGELDLADALDLDAAVTARAAQLKELGASEGLDARRAAAVGEIARADLMIDLAPGTAGTAGTEGTSGTTGAANGGTWRRGSRETVLYVHLSHDALTGGPDGRSVVGRLENTGDLVTADQLRQWCGNPFARVSVRPVLDLDEHIHVSSYEVPDRLAEQVNLRDGSCVFPWCARPARGCDHDHVVPHGREGGTTCSCNIAPLCRRHHRLKTHAVGWTYTVLDPGTYLWASPHGYRFIRDHTGTRDVTHDPPHRPG
jgi:hypothetical protein